MRIFWLKKNIFFILFILLNLLTGCSSFLYYPSQERYSDPSKAQISYRDTWIKTPDGIHLHGWYFKNQVLNSPRATIIFFHGNAENLTSHFVSLAWILPYGYDYFIFDYRGYGQSEGKPNPENTVKDGSQIIREIHHQNPKSPLIIFGQSLGGAIAMRSLIELNKEIPIQLLVIDSSFTSYRSVAQHVLSHHWMTWLFQPLAYALLSDEWAPGERIAELAPTPLIIMHGDHDRIVDFELGEQIFKLAKNPKEFWRIDGGHHTDAFWKHGLIYREKLLLRMHEALSSS